MDLVPTHRLRFLAALGLSASAHVLVLALLRPHPATPPRPTAKILPISLVSLPGGGGRLFLGTRFGIPGTNSNGYNDWGYWMGVEIRSARRRAITAFCSTRSMVVPRRRNSSIVRKIL